MAKRCVNHVFARLDVNDTYKRGFHDLIAQMFANELLKFALITSNQSVKVFTFPLEHKSRHNFDRVFTHKFFDLVNVDLQHDQFFFVFRSNFIQ